MLRVAPGEASPSAAESEQILQQQFNTADHIFGLADVGWLLKFDPPFGEIIVHPSEETEPHDIIEQADQEVDELVEVAADANHGPILIVGGFGTGEHAYAGARTHLDNSEQPHDVYQVITDRRHKGPEIMDTHAQAVIESLLVINEQLGEGEKITIVGHSLGGPKILLALAKALTDERYQKDAARLLNSIGNIIIDAGAGFDESLGQHRWPVATARITGRLANSLARTPLRMIQDRQAGTSRAAVPEGTTKEFLGYMVGALNESLGEAIVSSRYLLPLLDSLNQTALLENKFLIILRKNEGTVNTRRKIPNTLIELQALGIPAVLVDGYHDALSTSPEELRTIMTSREPVSPTGISHLLPNAEQTDRILRETPEYSWSQRKAVEYAGKVGTAALILMAGRAYRRYKRAA